MMGIVSSADLADVAQQAASEDILKSVVWKRWKAVHGSKLRANGAKARGMARYPLSR